MNRHLFLIATASLAGSLFAADSNPKDDITAAAKKLGEAASYSWKTTTVVPEGARFRPGATDGQTEKDGFTHLAVVIGDNTIHSVMKGDKAAVSRPEGGWLSVAELENGEGPDRFRAMLVRSFKAPAVQATDLAAGVKEFTKDGDAWSGELTEDGAKGLLSLRPRTGGDAPAISNAKGSAKFWLKDGALAKYEFKVSGKVSFNGNDRDVDRTTTVEIKDAGATKVDVPEEAKKKLE